MGQEVWVSYSSLSDYLNCPRAYYLKNVYRDPVSKHKISLMTPALALGQAVHQVLEGLAMLPVQDRFNESLVSRLPEAWKIVSGKHGGFHSTTDEEVYFARAEKMLQRVMESPGPLAKLAVKLTAPSNLPRYTLSESEQIILCGKIDWLRFVPDDDSVQIIDFKTGKHDEQESSLQLPIYYLLANHTQKRQVSGAYYWYLERESTPQAMPIPDLVKSEAQILQIGRDIKWARETGYRVCREDGCFACQNYQAILDGEAELVGTGGFGQDIYILPN